jgi:hypothetical protein
MKPLRLQTLTTSSMLNLKSGLRTTPSSFLVAASPSLAAAILVDNVLWEPGCMYFLEVEGRLLCLF